MKMPQCFQLIDKSTGIAEKFNLIDDRICNELLHVVPHTSNYVNGWYDYIGFGLACGQTFDTLRDKIQSQIDLNANEDNRILAYWLDMLLINNWLESNYTSSAWYERSKV